MPLILIWNRPLSLKQLHFKLTLQLLSEFQLKGAKEVKSTSKARLIIDKAFQFTILSPATSISQLHNIALSNPKQTCVPPTAQHLKSLFRRAIANFANNRLLYPKLVKLSRQDRPVPENLCIHVTELLSTAGKRWQEACKLIASTLVLDTTPGDLACRSR